MPAFTTKKAPKGLLKDALESLQGSQDQFIITLAEAAEDGMEHARQMPAGPEQALMLQLFTKTLNDCATILLTLAFGKADSQRVRVERARGPLLDKGI